MITENKDQEKCFLILGYNSKYTHAEINNYIFYNTAHSQLNKLKKINIK